MIAPDTEWNRALGRVIRREREMIGVRQSDLSQEIGLGINSLGRLERGENSCYIHTLRAVAEGLQISIIDLISATDREIERHRPRRTANSTGSD